MSGPAVTERLGDSASLLLLRDQLGRLLEVRDTVGEEHRVVREQLELRSGGAEGRRVRRVGVDDRAHVRPQRVDLGVDHGLQVQGGRGVVHLDHVVRPDLVEREALALDVDGVATGRPCADVAEGEVGEALQGQDAAGPGDLLAHRLGSGGDGHRRSVGG